jgi:hypothetical protein
LPIELFGTIRDFCHVFIEPYGAFSEANKSQLDELMTLGSAILRWPQLFTAIGLRRAARAGQFQHIHKGRKRVHGTRIDGVASPEEGRSFMSVEKLFEFGGMWIGRVQGSQQLYRFWYDSRNGEVRRPSLKTTDIEEAKKHLAEIVISDAPVKADDPEQVPLVFVLTHYLESHADSRPSAHVARRACDLVLRFLEFKCGFDAGVKTSQFSSIYQAEFAKWCASEFQHSPSYVSRVLSVIAAACRFAAITKLIKSNTGELKEAKLLRFVPEVNYDTKWVAEVMHVAEPKPRDYVPTYEELASLLDIECGELLRRYDMIALNTWARPEAIIDLSVAKQVDFENELIDLIPPNRRQKKSSDQLSV